MVNILKLKGKVNKASSIYFNRVLNYHTITLALMHKPLLDTKNLYMESLKNSQD